MDKVWQLTFILGHRSIWQCRPKMSFHSWFADLLIPIYNELTHTSISVIHMWKPSALKGLYKNNAVFLLNNGYTVYFKTISVKHLGCK